MAAATSYWATASYDSGALRQDLVARGARANVKLLPNRLDLPPFNQRLCRRRDLVERLFNKLTHFLAVAIRYDKRDGSYLASVKLASIRLWMRFIEPVA